METASPLASRPPRVLIPRRSRMAFLAPPLLETIPSPIPPLHPQHTQHTRADVTRNSLGGGPQICLFSLHSLPPPSLDPTVAGMRTVPALGYRRATPRPGGGTGARRTRGCPRPCTTWASWPTTGPQPAPHAALAHHDPPPPSPSPLPPEFQLGSVDPSHHTGHRGRRRGAL